MRRPNFLQNRLRRDSFKQLSNQKQLNQSQGKKQFRLNEFNDDSLETKKLEDAIKNWGFSFEKGVSLEDYFEKEIDIHELKKINQKTIRNRRKNTKINEHDIKKIDKNNDKTLSRSELNDVFGSPKRTRPAPSPPPQQQINNDETPLNDVFGAPKILRSAGGADDDENQYMQRFGNGPVVGGQRPPFGKQKPPFGKQKPPFGKPKPPFGKPEPSLTGLDISELAKKNDQNEIFGALTMHLHPDDHQKGTRQVPKRIMEEFLIKFVKAKYDIKGSIRQQIEEIIKTGNIIEDSDATAIDESNIDRKEFRRIFGALKTNFQNPEIAPPKPPENTENTGNTVKDLDISKLDYENNNELFMALSEYLYPDDNQDGSHPISDEVMKAFLVKYVEDIFGVQNPDQDKIDDIVDNNKGDDNTISRGEFRKKIGPAINEEFGTSPTTAPEQEQEQEQEPPTGTGGTNTPSEFNFETNKNEFVSKIKATDKELDDLLALMYTPEFETALEQSFNNKNWNAFMDRGIFEDSDLISRIPQKIKDFFEVRMGLQAGELNQFILQYRENGQLTKNSFDEATKYFKEMAISSLTNYKTNNNAIIQVDAPAFENKITVPDDEILPTNTQLITVNLGADKELIISGTQSKSMLVLFAEAYNNSAVFRDAILGQMEKSKKGPKSTDGIGNFSIMTVDSSKNGKTFMGGQNHMTMPNSDETADPVNFTRFQVMIHELAHSVEPGVYNPNDNKNGQYVIDGKDDQNISPEVGHVCSSCGKSHDRGQSMFIGAVINEVFNARANGEIDENSFLNKLNKQGKLPDYDVNITDYSVDVSLLDADFDTVRQSNWTNEDLRVKSVKASNITTEGGFRETNPDLVNTYEDIKTALKSGDIDTAFKKIMTIPQNETVEHKFGNAQQSYNNINYNDPQRIAIYNQRELILQELLLAADAKDWFWNSADPEKQNRHLEKGVMGDFLTKLAAEGGTEWKDHIENARRYTYMNFANEGITYNH